jgi:hypothetical protein
MDCPIFGPHSQGFVERGSLNGLNDILLTRRIVSASKRRHTGDKGSGEHVTSGIFRGIVHMYYQILRFRRYLLDLECLQISTM